MADEFAVVDIWVGLFESGLNLHDYLAERPEFYQDETESLSISQFAEDVGERFIDHDFECTMFVQERTKDISHLLQESLLTENFGETGGETGIDFLAAKYLEQRDEAVNSIVLVYGLEVSRPRSVQGSTFWLQYVGRFYEQ